MLDTIHNNISKNTHTTHPQCSVPGCTNLAAHMLAKSHPRYPTYRRSNWIKDMYTNASDNFCCNMHHQENTARKHGVKTAAHLTAMRNGFSSATEYKNSIHPYLRYRKDYCENIDGRLGFICNSSLPTQESLDSIGLDDWRPKSLLEVDHIDGNHTHNTPENLQTLCKNCHSMKTFANGDHRTPGRKTRITDTSITNIYISDSTVNIQSKE